LKSIEIKNKSQYGKVVLKETRIPNKSIASIGGWKNLHKRKLQKF